MSKYLLDKFLYTVDRDPELVERYRSDPAGTVEWWETEMANKILNCHDGEKSTWQAFTEEERRALRARVADLAWGWPGDDTLELAFSLPAGSYATAVLAQLGRVEDAGRP